MLNILFRLVAEMGPMAAWAALCVMAIAVMFVIYVGAAMTVTLFTTDPARAKIRYQVFKDLLRLFYRRHR
ncbi:hypothetical protein [Actinomadura bangladeshensis]|uniref:Uncharacterized protein n=1 Tax=Actinomadura bangladeshensis TaxID=453573 RepID=A0A4R4NVQ8_9ACTN|nr:hypothetical protein [Actinomadura bangladeshensis]TDC12193.1 hypothetical protein E1284_24720 [Actinomadura bangladeshensis]